MDKSLQTKHSIQIDVKPERLWSILTQPDHIAKYLFGTVTETDWKMGSPITFSGSYNGTTYCDKGVVMAIVPYTLIAYDYWTQFSGLADIPENYCEVSYHIKDIGNGKVEFTWQQIGFKNEEGMQHNNDSMPALLQKIKEVAEH